MAAVAENVRELVELLSKLNPFAEEFVPSRKHDGRLSADAPIFVKSPDYNYETTYKTFSFYFNGGNKEVGGDSSSKQSHRRSGHYIGRRGSSERIMKAEMIDCIKRTVYVADIDHQVTEQELASLFSGCGQINDCRVCGDPHSVLRFAFIEFEDEYAANVALSLSGAMLGFHPLRVLPSKTAILPVNPIFLPKNADEKDMCTRTVYCTNIDKKVNQGDIRSLFESTCGKVSRLRLLGDNMHPTRIAFVEFFQAQGAVNALNCSGLVLGTLPIRVSPSKTPVRPRTPRVSSR